MVVGLGAPWIAPHEPNAQDLVGRLQPPVWETGGSTDHLLGTDHLGRDVLSRLIHGARISLLVVAVSVPLSVLLGSTFGLLAGLRGGLIDKLLMRLVDVQLALPAIIFAVLLASAYGASLRNVIIIIVVFRWAGFARLVRGEVLSLRERDFVLATRSVGASEARIAVRHIVPNIVDVVVVLATLDIAAVILIEAALSFLGVGVPPPTPSWGAMVSDGRSYITIAWWLALFPGLAILIVSLSGNLIGDWLRDFLDPKLRR
ncbi:MAG TPA: ABC transporter permease [Opitutaceae bacterium]|nr:ABC transporter permease [Opitutaceae bacterium]